MESKNRFRPHLPTMDFVVSLILTDSLFSNGVSAVELCGRSKPDLILTDHCFAVVVAPISWELFDVRVFYSIAAATKEA